MVRVRDEDSHELGCCALTKPGKVGAGLARPLEEMLRPGLDHPPPGTGEGLRERVIGKPGVPVYDWKRKANN